MSRYKFISTQNNWTRIPALAHASHDLTEPRLKLAGIFPIPFSGHNLADPQRVGDRPRARKTAVGGGAMTPLEYVLLSLAVLAFVVALTWRDAP